MAEAQSSGRDTLPKIGRVNEVCREWLIREDGALAYRLQSEEISEHYTGNRYRNAQVREDFPCALDEQIREQRLAEQAAALYHQMITEQEEQDAMIAKQLAEKIEREEQEKKKAIEEEDEEIARQLLEREKLKQQRLLVQQQALQHDIHQAQSHQALIPSVTQSHQAQNYHIQTHSAQNYPNQQIHQTPPNYQNVTQSHPQRPQQSDLPESFSTRSPRKINHDAPKTGDYQRSLESPRRQGCPMPLPGQSSSEIGNYKSSSDDLLDPFQQCSIADALDLGLPVDEIDEKRMQEERDAELARKLQEQESAEEIQLNRDRLLAIEAQDKELAKMLQERERAKIRRAKERAKQKALAKKQQMELNPDQILPDDSYSNPVDLLQHPECSHNANYRTGPSCQQDDDVNYSYPVDVLPTKAPFDHNLKQNYSPQKSYESRINGFSHKNEIRAVNGGFPPGGSSQGFVGTSGLPHPEREVHTPAVRPTQLDLKSPITKSLKPRPTDPDSVEVCDPIQPDNNYTQHANIAMAIDPTYTRRTISQTPSSQETSTLSTSTTASSTTSPAISLPPPDLSEDELSPVPPYMPIQGQRRTASLEKKQKRRAKDGCKQQ